MRLARFAGSPKKRGLSPVSLQLPPREALVLGRHRYPPGLAAQRLRERASSQFRRVVRSREVRSDHMLEPAAVERREYLPGGSIVKMPEAARDAGLERRPIRPARAHIGTVVA